MAGWIARLRSRTTTIKPITLGVALCSQKATYTKELKGNRETTMVSALKYVPIVGWCFNITYHLMLAGYAKEQQLTVSHTCTGGPTHHKQVQVDVKFHEEEWEIWDTTGYDVLVARATVINPISQEAQRCLDWRPCSEAIVVKDASISEQTFE